MGAVVLSAQETAARWGVGRAYVTSLARTGRIPGATRANTKHPHAPWLIPADATKPEYMRTDTHALGRGFRVTAAGRRLVSRHAGRPCEGVVLVRLQRVGDRWQLDTSGGEA